MFRKCSAHVPPKRHKKIQQFQLCSAFQRDAWGGHAEDPSAPPEKARRRLKDERRITGGNTPHPDPVPNSRHKLARAPGRMNGTRPCRPLKEKNSDQKSAPSFAQVFHFSTYFLLLNWF